MIRSSPGWKVSKVREKLRTHRFQTVGNTSTKSTERTAARNRSKSLKSRDEDRLLEKRAQAAQRSEGEEDGHFELELMRARRQWVAPSKKAHQPGTLYPAGHLSDVREK